MSSLVAAADQNLNCHVADRRGCKGRLKRQSLLLRWPDKSGGCPDDAISSSSLVPDHDSSSSPMLHPCLEQVSLL